jgi:hypothetical protein
VWRRHVEYRCCPADTADTSGPAGSADTGGVGVRRHAPVS